MCMMMDIIVAVMVLKLDVAMGVWRVIMTHYVHTSQLSSVCILMLNKEF